MSRTSRLDDMIDKFNLHFPFLNKHAVDYELTGDWWLTVKLDDGTAVMFDEMTDSFRSIPRDPDTMTDAQRLREFGYRLKVIMRRKGYSQGELAERIGVSQSVFSGYVNGKHCPSLHVLDKIARVLNCSIDEFRYL